MAVALKVTRKKKMKPIAPPHPGSVMVGFPRGNVAPAVINRAIWNEFGTRGGASGGGWGGPIPERPFMRNAMRGNRAKYQTFMRASAKLIMKGERTVDQSLARLGILAQGDIQHEITVLTSPPNAPTTVELKGSSKPLIDTGQMRQAVTWRIVPR